jgi:hypothetical protein
MYLSWKDNSRPDIIQDEGLLLFSQNPTSGIYPVPAGSS